MRALFALLCMLTCIPAMAGAQERVSLRGGDHANYGRVVFDWQAPPRYNVQQQGESVALRFEAPADFVLDALRRMPRNVLGAQAVPGGVDVRVRPGATIRHFRIGNRVALDVLDPPADAPQAQPTATATPEPASRRNEPARPAPAAASPPVAAPAPRPSAPEPASPRREPQRAAEAPVARAAPNPEPPATLAEAPRPAEPPAAAPPRPEPRREVLLPFPPDSGAALLQRGDVWMLALDAAPSAATDVVLEMGWRLQAIPGGTLLTHEGEGPWHLRRSGTRWVLARGSAPASAAIQPVVESGTAATLLLPVVGAHRVLNLQDPSSGLPLLIGTLRGEGGHVAMPRRLVDLTLLDTSLGLALVARSDSVSMRAGQDRFTVQAEGQSRLALGAGAAAPAPPAVALSRSFDFPAGTLGELSTRLRSQQAGIAQAPPLTRGPQRIAATETLLALGQPQEAQAMIRLALAEDPVTAANPTARWLAGVAALLAGRPEEAQTLAGDPPSAEAALWRGLLLAEQGDGAAAAPLLAAGAALLTQYPPSILRRILPRAAEQLARARQADAGTELLRHAPADLPGTELARAMLAEQRGEAATALDGYDMLISGRDRRMRAEAMRRAAELRLARGEIDALEASRRLERSLYAWRQEGDELPARRRIAALRRDGGDAHGALELLQETAALHPEAEAELRAEMRSAFVESLRQSTALGAVTMHDAHPELMPEGAAGDEAATLLAERLAALDLTDRAALVMRQAINRAGSPARRAALGTRLASMRLAERDAAGALRSLADTHAPDLPAELQRERDVLAARAEAQSQGGGAAALAALGPAREEALAEHLAEARDFAGAAAALGRFLRRELAGHAGPVQGPLARSVVRHAALLALAGDNPGLARARLAHAPLLTGSPAEAPFRLLTTDPVRGLADLPRIQNELELFRTMPARLDSLRTATAPTR